MLNKIGVYFCLLGLPHLAPAVAHDFWVQPSEYRLLPGVVTPLTLQVGHGPYRQRSPIPLGRITRFSAVTPTGTSLDLRERLHPGAAQDDGSLVLAEPGTYIVVLETDNRAQSHLPAIRFNDYLQVEGLTPALEERKRSQRMDADGSEIYSRHAKAIVQVDGSDARAVGSSRWVTQPLGLPLEIVPEISPYSVPKAADLPVRVLYQGRPLAGALIKLTQLEHDAEPFQTQRTNAAGRAIFTLPGAGNWLLNVIWTQPLPKTSEADFETVFSSLSFGFPAHAAPK